MKLKSLIIILVVLSLVFFVVKTFDSRLTVDQINNAAYRIDDKTVTLSGGAYKSGDTSISIDQTSVVYDEQHKKALMIISNSEGGTGQFKYLAYFDGKTNPAPVISLEDRAVVKALKFDGDRISVAGTFHADSDPSCCPTLEKTLFFEYSNGQLNEIKS